MLRRPNILTYRNVIYSEAALLGGAWMLDEVNGTAAADLKGTNAGVYSGGITFDQLGPFARSNIRTPLFNGTTGKVRVSSGIVSALPFAAEIWFYATSNTDSVGRTMLAFSNSGNDNLFARLAHFSGIVYADINGPSGYRSTFSGGTTLTLNTWQHLAAIWTTSAVNCYFNGTLLATVSNTNTMPTFDRVALGVLDRPSTAEFFQGRLAGAAVYTTPPAVDRFKFHVLAAQNGVMQ